MFLNAEASRIVGDFVMFWVGLDFKILKYQLFREKKELKHQKNIKRI